MFTEKHLYLVEYRISIGAVLGSLLVPFKTRAAADEYAFSKAQVLSKTLAIPTLRSLCRSQGYKATSGYPLRNWASDSRNLFKITQVSVI